MNNYTFETDNEEIKTFNCTLSHKVKIKMQYGTVFNKEYVAIADYNIAMCEFYAINAPHEITGTDQLFNIEVHDDYEGEWTNKMESEIYDRLRASVKDYEETGYAANHNVTCRRIATVDEEADDT